MINRGWISVMTAIVLGVSATALVDAQKGGKPRPPSELAATAGVTCPVPGTCGIEGDASGTNPARLLTSTGEMNLTLGGIETITLDFRGAMGQFNAGSDCPNQITGCLWTLGDRSTFSNGFQMQTNTLDPSGETELEGGLLGIPAGSADTYRARFNMTITIPGSSSFWRFDFNPNIPPNGGAGLVNVVRVDACTWQLTPGVNDGAALSILVKPPKGKQHAHREGLFSMPFELTFHVPSLCGQ